MLLAGYQLRSKAIAEQRPVLSGLWPAAPAIIGAFLLFLLQIQFRLGEFLQNFRMHAQTLGGRRVNLIINFFNENAFLNDAQSPLILFAIGLFVFARPPKGCELGRTALTLAAVLPVVGLAGALGAGTLWYINLMLLLWASALLKAGPAFGLRLKLMLALALCLANVEVPITAYGEFSGHISRDLGPEWQQASTLRSTPGRAVLVDESVARYALGYRITSGFFDMHFAMPFPHMFTGRQMAAGDIYLVGPGTVDWLKACTLLDVPTPKWSPFALHNRQFASDPRRVFVIPAENCPSRDQKP
jgi:hypothetical protein